MEKSSQQSKMPALLLCPAFRVENCIVTEVNDAAAARSICIGDDVRQLIHIGEQEFSEFTQGRLDLTLRIDNTICNASVHREGDGYLFCLDPDYAQPELRAFALAAQHLREPLSNAVISTENMLASPESLSSPNAKTQLSHLNRSLQQMMRILCNMSDASGYANSANLQTRNVVSIFEEVLTKAQGLLAKAGRSLKIQLPQQVIYCSVDEKMLERAILNLLSNAVKFSEGSACVEASLTLKNQRLYFTVLNPDGGRSPYGRDLFSRYLREPLIEEGRAGIGLGLPIVRCVAAAHGGTVLMDQPDSDSIRFTLTLAVQNSDAQSLRSAVRIPYDYSGGWDHCLLELSGVLPAELYEN